MSKIGFVCDGGCARGAYHMGVYKAYVENGYQFDGFVGTSIGAMNAAILASGKFETALKLWESITIDQLFEKEVSELFKLTLSKVDKSFPGALMTALMKVLRHKGVDTTQIRDFIAPHLDESQLRASGIDFGLVTVSRSERKAYELFLDDIPEGKLIDYIMASSNFPGFQAQKIDGKKFIDGAIYNNCPINMLLDRGYDEVIAVRTNAYGFVKKYDKNANVTLVKTNANLFKTFAFSPDNSIYDINRGYQDGLKAIHGLQEIGDYYQEPLEPHYKFSANN